MLEPDALWVTCRTPFVCAECADSRRRVGTHGHDPGHKDQRSNDGSRQQPCRVEPWRRESSVI